MKVIPPLTIGSVTNFTRASTATYTDIAGNISTAAISAVRTTYDPITHESNGTILESTATNLLTYSEQMDVWSNNGLAVTANAMIAPDGNMTAETSNAPTGTRYMASSGIITAGLTYTYSFYVKPPVGATSIFAYIDGPSGNGYVTLDIATGSYSGLYGDAISGQLKYFNNGWYRASVTFIPTTTSNCACHIFPTFSGTYGWWGAQLELGSTPTSYIPTTTSAVVRAADITAGSGLFSSSIAEPDSTVGEVAWNAATNYTTGTRVVRTTTHKVYERLAPGGADATLPENDSSKWLVIGPTNKWAMFDTSRTSGSSSTSTVTIVLAPGVPVDSIAILGCTALDISINITNGSYNVYSNTVDMLVRSSANYTQYFFGAFRFLPSLVLFNLPNNSNNIITITFIMPATGGLVGNIVIGTSVSLGDIQTGVSIEALNFSVVNRDTFGNSVLVPRRSVPKTSQKVFITKADLNNLINTRYKLNAVPAVWVGIDDNSDGYFDSLLIFGVYKDFSMVMDYPDHALLSLELEEI